MTPHEKQPGERLSALEQRLIELEAALLRERAKSKALSTLFEERLKVAAAKPLFWGRPFGAAFEILCRDEETRILAAVQKTDAAHARALKAALR